MLLVVGIKSQKEQAKNKDSIGVIRKVELLDLLISRVSLVKSLPPSPAG